MFWQLTFAIRNTLLFGFTVALISRLLALVIGLVSGYKGGWIDRVLMSVNDTFIVIPLLPILVLFYFVMRDSMSWLHAGADHGLPRLGLRCAADPLGRDEPEDPRIHPEQRVFRHDHPRDPGAGASALRMPIVFSTTMNNMVWSIGLEVTLAVLGFTDINTPTIGGMIYWANQHTAMVAGVWWWIAFPTAVVIMTFIGLFLLAVSMNEYIDPRSRLAAWAGRRDELRRPLQRNAAARCRAAPILSVRDLQAHFRTSHFGVNRYVRAVDGITLRRPAQRDLRPCRRIQFRQDHA